MTAATLTAPRTTTATALTARQRIDKMAAEMWALPHEQIMQLISHRVPKFEFAWDLNGFRAATAPDGHERGYGWWVIDPEGKPWPLDANDLPDCMALDVESTKEHNQRNELSQDNDWHPFLAVAYGVKGNPEDEIPLHDPFYYIWVGPRDNSQRLIEVPPDRTLITFNGGVHDSKYLSCEYEGEPLPIIHLDVMALVTMYRGICDDKQQATYRKYAANKRGGKAAPEWSAHATPASLDESAKNILGMPIVKGINTLDPEAPQNVVEYCAQDVAITVQLLQRVYPTLRQQFINSDATWVGMAASMGLAAYVGDSWSAHCKKLDDAEITDRKAQKAWSSYHRNEYSKLYVNDGAVKVGINPVSDPVSRFPKSGVWCHDYSDAFPAFDASQEDGCMVAIMLSVPEKLVEAAGSDVTDEAECGYSLLLPVQTPESIEYETDKRKAELIKRFKKESLPTDLLHCALAIANYEIMERELDARVSEFGKHDGVVTVGLMGSDDDREQLEAIRDQVEDLCLQLCDEVMADMGVAF